MTHNKAKSAWICPNCPGKPEFEHRAFIEHVREIHKLTELKGRRQMQLHLDCADEHVTQYDWTIGELTFHQTVICPREKNDPMRLSQ